MKFGSLKIDKVEFISSHYGLIYLDFISGYIFDDININYFPPEDNGDNYNKNYFIIIVHFCQCPRVCHVIRIPAL